MATKTKAELLEEITQKNSEIENLKKEIAILDKYKQYKDMADEFKAMHTALEVSGFTSEQAFDLLKDLLRIAPDFMNKQTTLRRSGCRDIFV
jgi:lipid A disaccharide synthetase